MCKLCSTKYYWEVFCASLVVRSSTGKYFAQALQYEALLGSTLCKLCSTKSYWEVLCASFVVRSRIGKYIVQALWYEVVLGSTLCKLCTRCIDFFFYSVRLIPIVFSFNMFVCSTVWGIQWGRVQLVCSWSCGHV